MIYEPAEDSFIILKHVKDYSKDKKVLDLGTGSGILAREAKKYAKEVTASDINKECELKDIEFIQSDLFENINERFDLIIFNPPYLPKDEREDEESALSTTGGVKGYEVTEKFLKEVRDHLNPKGKILLLFSSLTDKEKVDALMEQNGFNFKILESRKIMFEVLYCYLIYRK